MYNHVWGNNYQTNIEKLYLIQKKLISGLSHGLHSEQLRMTLCIANSILNVTDMNNYIIATFMNERNIPNSFQ